MPLVASTMSPDEAWQPLVPTAEQSFDRRLAAHLYRRAGFAASPDELAAAVKRGLARTVEQLLTAGQRSAAFDDDMRKFADVTLASGNPELLSGWWLHRMRHTPAPLVEKMTLFWHGHFATSAAKVRKAELMLAQNELLRRHALGNFGDLVRGIARDPAMLLYLDSATNRKVHPNENFAREVMELFCLGLGHYTERDIQQLARCFTGWEIQHEAFKFNQYQHDYGSKTVLGKTGNFDGDEGLAIILEQPATAEFLARKLVRFFVSDELELSSELVAPLAQRLREAKLTVAPVLETIFTSRLFYSDAAIGGKIRSPIELGVGTLRALDGTTNMVELAGKLRELGQMPLYPPNVKGWDGGRAWINSSTLLGRANLVRSLVHHPENRFGGRSLDAWLDARQLPSAEATVDFLADLLVAAPLPAEVRRQLVEVLDRPERPRPQAIRDMLHVLGSLPEFQLA